MGQHGFGNLLQAYIQQAAHHKQVYAKRRSLLPGNDYRLHKDTEKDRVNAQLHGRRVKQRDGKNYDWSSINEGTHDNP